jgi:Crinkler effector protein N-terminal domain
MAEESNFIVWVQLYIGEDKGGDVFKMRVRANHDIDDLKKALAEECKDDLGSIHYSKLRVYKAGTEFPPKEEDRLRPSLIVPTDTTDESPLRVLAPGKS